ncbi:PAS domain S-box protein [Beijerinckiaceae bacterium]|nr:PAS domain S-box protein [Beijerinckiaceae bacterium]
MMVDPTDGKQAAEAEQWLAAIVECSDDAIISKNVDGIITTWNLGAERLFGYTAEEIIGKPITILIPPERIDEEPGILARIRRGERIDHYETVRRCKDGSLVDISLTVSPVKDADGRIIGASKIARDITERRRAQELQSLLLNEMRHRIKNTLAIVQAIAMRTLRSSSADERAAFTARLQALASAHDLLTPESWNRTSLRSLVDSVLEPFNETHRQQFLIEGPDDVWLPTTKSLPLALALHELATNAVKYGSLSKTTGRVHIGWGRIPSSPSDRLTFRWQESGGPPVKAPGHQGFGTLLIERALQAELGAARLEFTPQGLICTLEISL